MAKKTYILGQRYLGAEPGDVVELEESEAANLLSVTEIPTAKPKKLSKPKAKSKAKKDVEQGTSDDAGE